MANQTISVDRNGDEAAINGLANAESYLINSGAKLTLNSDSRWGQQAAVIGAITIDSATGGSVLIDGRDVWWVPYDGGTGTVPALGTVGVLDVTRSGVGVAEFLGIFTARGVAPTVNPAAMPTTGFAKFRRTTATLVDNDVLTFSNGATITVNSATGGERGWLHIVGAEGTTITVPRLGKFEVLGDWFELGTAAGTNDETMQYYVADFCPAGWVETSAGSGVYEVWVHAGTTRWGQHNRVSNDVRGKIFGCSSAGLLTFARTASSITGGVLLPAGAKVRVPNIHISSSVSTWGANTVSTTPATRWDFTTTSAGDIDLDKVNGNWYLSLTQPFKVDLSFVGTLDQINITECASTCTLNNVGVGLSAAVDLPPLSIITGFGGTTITDSFFLKYEAEANDTGVVLTDVDNITVSNTRFYTFGDNTAATLTRGATTAYAITLSRCSNGTFSGCFLGGAGANFVTCQNLTFTNTVYYDAIEGRRTSTSNGVYAFLIGSGSSDITIDGFIQTGLNSVHPNLGILSANTCKRITMQNIGSPTAPFDGGGTATMVRAALYGGNGSDHVVRRCYFTQLLTDLVSMNNADTKLTFVDFRGDGADTLIIRSNNVVAKGLAGTNTTTGQTAVYGSHCYDTFTAATTGRIVFIANEPTALSTSQLQIISGTPTFTSTGICRLTTVGDEIIWEMPYLALGHTALANAAPTVTGTNVTFSSNARWGNHDLFFQYDIGSGYNGAWLDFNQTNLATVTTIDPAIGIKIKLRAVCAVTSSTNAISYIRIDTVSTSLAQQTQYPLPGIPVELTGLITGSEVRAYLGTDPATATELAGIESTTGSTFSFTHNNTGSSGFIVIFTLGYQPVRLNITYSANAVSIPVQPTIDRNFDNPV